MSKPSAHEIIDLLGGTAAVAALCGIKPPSVSEWRSKGAIPKDKLQWLAPQIERASGGKWACEVLMPSLTWRRVRDRDWPWHKQGRPLLDLSAEAA